MSATQICKMADQEDGLYSSEFDDEFKDDIAVSLLPREGDEPERKGILRYSKLNPRRAAIIVAVSFVLLLVIVLLAVYVRSSSTNKALDRQKSTISLRLPRHLLPIEYHLYLHPNLTTFKFSGKVDISLYCNEAANNITLHAGEKLYYSNVQVSFVPDGDDKENSKLMGISKISRLSGEMIYIKLNSKVERGKNYYLSIEFHSELNRGLSGFYLSTYNSSSGEVRYLATTQFEATDARNAFPCFDEPNMKANFTIVMTREKRHVALANMPLDHTEGCNDTVKLCTDHFQQSVKMSTYLVAFIVCDFKSITSKTSKGVTVSVWAPPEQIDQGQFALEVAVKVLEYYEDLFKVKYPLPKQDLVAIPDFAAGAMENWGLITYRLTSLLYNKNKSSDSNKERVAVVVAHELAHQWFGNLVTMEWWNDLWLNEGFASFMEFMGVNHTQPDWKMMELSIYENFQGAMSEDQLSNSHPIMAEVKDPAQINALFDSISYDKGAAIIRMLEDVLGSEVFFQGLQKYLKKYSYSNAQTNDLWQSLTQESISSEGEINVTEMMTSWTSQMGFPVISVKRENKILHIEQQHFLVHSNDKQLTASSSDSRPMWVVPLTFVTQQSKNRSSVLMKKRTIEVKLSPDLSDKSWIKMNAGQTGFYRVNYEKENWDKLVRHLHTEAKELSTVDRSGLLDDALNLARSGMLDYEVALNLTSYLTKEKEYVPWMSALDNMGYFAIQFSTYDSLKGSSDYYPTYKKYVSYLLHDIAAELSWEEKDDDPHLRRYLRPALLKMAAIYEDVLSESKQRYTAKAKKYFNDWLDKGKPISPNVRYAIYTIGLRVANDSVWTKVFYRYQTETVPSEKKKLMYALTTSQNEVILKRLLKYSLDETKIRSQDSVSVIDSIARNPQGSLLAWQFVQDNYHELYQRYGVGSFDFSRLITSNTAHFNTEEMKTQVSQFFAKVNQGSGERAVRQSLESIEGNIKWMKDHGPAVNKWLKNFLNRKNVSK